MTDIKFNTAIVVFNNGPFGGAPKRNINLFLYLNKTYPGKFHLFVNELLYKQILNIYPDLPLYNIMVVDHNKKTESKNIPRKDNFIRNNYGIILDPLDIDKNTILPRKIYWFYKNYFKQYALFKQIERYQKELDIKVFVGVFSGILPLIFFLKQIPRKSAIIFSDMDSWFSEVHSDMKRLWYRKYYSFNYALENCDLVDFLSPYILKGIKERGISLKEDSIYIAPCSFADYSRCSVGDKKRFEVAFSARLEPDKNPMMYLEAANEVLKTHPDIKFHILGEGSLENDIKNFIKTNNLTSNINFQFHKNPSEILKETNIFVSIQSNTNYPSQSVLEAMACGNAIIASDVGDTRLLVNDNNGILINLNKNELLAALERLINDKPYTHMLGLNGHEMVLKTHKIESYSDYFLTLIENAYKSALTIKSINNNV